MPEIEFHCSAALSDIPEPYPASRHVPEWFKAMPADVGPRGTAKRCAPFLEAMTAGYIIPAPGNVRFTKKDFSGVSVAFTTHSFIELHHEDEYASAPFAGKPVVKFANPWIIVTPPNVVCLITAPINRYEMPFLPITGIVETDTFYKQVAQPMVCLMNTGDVFVLQRGAPMIQVIPIRREDWFGRTATLDEARAADQRARIDANPHAYKEELWKKLRFS
jgi:hypothetical protein